MLYIVKLFQSFSIVKSLNSATAFRKKIERISVGCHKTHFILDIGIRKSNNANNAVFGLILYICF